MKCDKATYLLPNLTSKYLKQLLLKRTTVANNGTKI